MKTDKQQDRKGKLKRIYDQEEGKIRKQLSFAKAEIERLKENRKITKKGRKNRSQLQRECKTISVAGLVSYMEKKRVGALKVRTWAWKKEERGTGNKNAAWLQESSYGNGYCDAILGFKNFIKSNNKIPHYARDYKKEYLFIRGLDKEFKYFYNHLDEINDGLFKSKRSDRLCNLIKRFLRGQEKGKLKDISDFVIYEDDVDYLIKIKREFHCYKIRYDVLKESSDDDYDDDSDVDDVDDPYPGFENIYYYFELFFSKLNIEYEDSDSDEYDSGSEELNLSYTDSDIEDFSNNLNILVNF